MAAPLARGDPSRHRATSNLPSAASPASPETTSPFSPTSQMTGWQQDGSDKMARAPIRADLPMSKHSVSLAVPYANTMPCTRPTLGDRPLQANSYAGGVAKHARTATPNHETAPSRTGKRTLNLLNPVHLLMRRRSHVTQTAQDADVPTKSLTVPPMTLPADYDPRIRGKVVHDFSAPRLRPRVFDHDEKTASVLAHSEAKSSNGPAPVEVKHNDRYSAAFREHLEDDSAGHQRASAIHAESLADQRFLQRLSQQGQSMLPTAPTKAEHADFQSFRRSISDWQARIQASTPPDSEAGLSTLQKLEGERRAPDRAHDSPHVGSEGRSSYPYSGTDNGRFSHSSSGERRQRASSATLLSQHSDQAHAGTIPKHVKSNASRFSFQLGGNENAAEERILEERAKHKRVGSSPKQQVIPDEDEDYFDEDAMYDVDELEGLDEEAEYGVGLGLGHQELSKASINHPAYGTTQVTPASRHFEVTQDTKWRDNVMRQGPADVHDIDDILSSYENHVPARSSQDDASEMESKRSDSHQGLQGDLVAISKPKPKPKPKVKPGGREHRKSRASHDFDDEFYFNDGTIFAGDDEAWSDGDDESVMFGSDAEREELSEEVTSGLVSGHTAHETGKHQDKQQKHAGWQAPPSSHQSISPGTDRTTLLHSALAEAANKAASEGRFSRTTSNGTSESETRLARRYGARGRDGSSGSSGQQPALNRMSSTASSAASTAGHGLPNSPFASAWVEDNYLEDSLDDFAGDDGIISEANAEALASDEEGFYGREFGFYARARPGSAEDEPINGGFFGTPGESNMERKYSIKEPNLTPITERSEFSARNSVIGGPGRWSPAALSSNPAALAAQLARMSPIALAELQEDYSDLDISLEQMLRLRNLAFNGSERGGGGRSGSISSLSSSAAGGWGLSQRGSWASAGPFASQVGAARAAAGSRMSRSHSDSPEVINPAVGGTTMRTYSPNSGIAGSAAATESTGSTVSLSNSRLASAYGEVPDAPTTTTTTTTTAATAPDSERTPQREKREETADSPIAPSTTVRIKPRQVRSRGDSGAADVYV